MNAELYLLICIKDWDSICNICISIPKSTHNQTLLLSPIWDNRPSSHQMHHHIFKHQGMSTTSELIGLSVNTNCCIIDQWMYNEGGRIIYGHVYSAMLTLSELNLQQLSVHSLCHWHLLHQTSTFVKIARSEQFSINWMSRVDNSASYWGCQE